MINNRTEILRSCCDIDVLIDREIGKVTTELKFKPEFVDGENRASHQWRRFGCADAVDELERQGIVVDNPNHIGYIDNHIEGKHNVTYEFTLPAPKAEKKVTPAKKPSSTSKKKATPKKD